MLLACYTAAQANPPGKNYKSPFQIFGISSDSLLSLKPGGKKIVLNIQSGHKSNAIQYQENWFDLGKVNAKYLFIHNKVTQINLTFPTTLQRDSAVKIISNFLGGDPYSKNTFLKDAKPKFSAHWVTGSVSYTLNDCTDSLTMNVKPLMLNNYDKYKLPVGTYVIQRLYLDVTGDGVADEISLVGHRYDLKTFFYDKLYLILYDGKTKEEKVTGLPKEYAGSYDPVIQPANFTNKKFSEIFYCGATGGSGGIINYLIYSFKNSEPVLLFSPDSSHLLHITGRFENNYLAKVYLKESGKSFDLSLLHVKNNLDELNYYKSGKLIKNGDVWINSYGMMEVRNSNKDGLYELYGTQAIKGVANYMTIGFAYSTWRYNGNKFLLVDTKVTGIKN